MQRASLRQLCGIPSRIGALAFALVSVACGPTTAPQNDGGSGSGGAGGGGGATGASGEDAGGTTDLSGEFWIEASGETPIHVRILSNDEAEIGATRYSIEHFPGAALTVDESTRVDADTPLTGPFVLSVTGTSMPRIAVSEINESFGTEAVVLRQTTARCLMPPSWRAVPSTVRPDLDPTVVSTNLPEPPGFLPWQSFQLQASKSAASVLSSGITAQANETPVPITWMNESASSADGAFPDWLPLLGQTVELAGDVSSTNGVASPVEGLSLDVLDFGPARTGSVDFRDGVPADLTVIGGAAELREGPCTDGCLHAPSRSSILLRLSDVTTSIEIQWYAVVAPPTGQMLSARMRIDWATPGGASGTSNFDAFSARGPGSVVASVPLSTPPTGDVFLALSFPAGSFNPQTDPNCGRSFSWDAHIQSITID